MSNRTEVKAGDIVQLWVSEGSCEVAPGGIHAKGPAAIALRGDVDPVLRREFSSQPPRSGIVFQIVFPETVGEVGEMWWDTDFREFLRGDYLLGSWVRCPNGACVRARICKDEKSADDHYQELIRADEPASVLHATTLRLGETDITLEDALRRIEREAKSGLPKSAIARLRALRGLDLESGIGEIDLSESRIKRLVSSDDHQEVCKLFSEARRYVGLEALQSAFAWYQKAIEALDDGSAKTWDLSFKSDVKRKLNALAKAVGAVLVGPEGDQGYIVITGGGRGTFQLRKKDQGEVRVSGLGQRLPALSLAPLAPRGIDSATS